MNLYNYDDLMKAELRKAYGVETDDEVVHIAMTRMASANMDEVFCSVLGLEPTPENLAAVHEWREKRKAAK